MHIHGGFIFPNTENRYIKCNNVIFFIETTQISWPSSEERRHRRVINILIVIIIRKLTTGDAEKDTCNGAPGYLTKTEEGSTHMSKHQNLLYRERFTHHE